MKYASVCSGIEAATVAWHPIGWEPVWFSEIEAFPSLVLQHHYPEVPNLGDMTKLNNHEHYHNTAFDLLVGGTPCQSFSVAGRQRGLDDERGNLALEYCRILLTKQPRWFVWENVPGVLSSNHGRDFATLLRAFQECGYSIAYRILDAQYFGVPQRRRRVFVVGYLGNDWRPPVAVLFERESLSGNYPKGGKARTKVAGTLGAGSNKRGWRIGADEAAAGHIIPCWWDGGSKGNAHNAALIFQSRASASQSMNPSGISPTLDKSKAEGMTVYFQQSQSGVVISNTAGTLRSSTGGGVHDHGIITNISVRRLTPLECERLQGFPDGYTKIPGAKDSPRYKAIGNSMAVPVMAWIGQRIDKVDKIIKNLKP